MAGRTFQRIRIEQIKDIGAKKLLGNFSASDDRVAEISIDDHAGGGVTNNDNRIPSSLAVQNYVGAENNAQDLDIQGDSGTGSVLVNSQVLDIAGGVALTSAAAGQTITLNLDDTAVTPGSYGATNKSLAIQVDQQGRLTSASAAVISITHNEVSDFDAGVRTNKLNEMTSPDGDVNFNSQKITNLAAPSADNDAARKAYVDEVAQGLSVQDSVVAATTANHAGLANLANGDAIDGVTLATNDRILVKEQTTQSENGVYVVKASGAPDRAPGFENGVNAAGFFMFVEEGTINADSGFVCTSDKGGDTVGTDALVFAQFSGAGSITAGTGLTKSGNTINAVVGNGLLANANDIQLVLQGSTLFVDGSGLKINTDGVTKTEIHADVAGTGLVQNGDGSLSPNMIDCHFLPQSTGGGANLTNATFNTTSSTVGVNHFGVAALHAAHDTSTAATFSEEGAVLLCQVFFNGLLQKSIVLEDAMSASDVAAGYQMLLDGDVDCIVDFSRETGYSAGADIVAFQEGDLENGDRIMIQAYRQ